MKIIRKFIAVLLVFCILIGIGYASLVVTAAVKNYERPDNTEYSILQLTDIHIVNNAKKDAKAFKTITKMIEETNPDMIAVTGDITSEQDNESAIKSFSEFIEKFNIPWSFSFGNHDSEGNWSKEEISAYLEGLNNCIFESGDENVDGSGNYYKNITDKNGNVIMTAIMMDSNMYYPDETIGGYDCFHENQIEWYENTIKSIAKQVNGDEAKVVPSLLFIHIPLYEYTKAYDIAKQNGEILSGRRFETECHSNVDDNMFETIVKLGSTKGVFAGHDHMNDYSVDYQGVRLTYGNSCDHNIYVVPRRGGTLINVKADGTFSTQQLVHYRYVNSIAVKKEKSSHETVDVKLTGKKNDKNYIKTVGEYSFWNNTFSNSIPQYNIYNVINDFMNDGEIVNGHVVSNQGKTKKVLFLGLDGMRADAVSNLMHDANSFDTNGYNNYSEYSGINLLSQTGGVYLAYCGGEKGTETQQQTSTSASWTSQFTGVWGNSHGIKTNDDIKNLEYKTIMLEYAEKGIQTTLAFDWDQYFDINLKPEVKYAMENPNIKIKFCDPDRIKTSDAFEDMYAENIELYNFVANDSLPADVPYDSSMKTFLEKRIVSGDDMVFGIFHNIDSNGHTYGFSNDSSEYVNSVHNCDTYSYDLIKLVQDREKNNNEEWLIIMANDHGGTGKGHGEQSSEERTTWIACNKTINSKYFSKGYNGFTINN